MRHRPWLLTFSILAMMGMVLLFNRALSVTLAYSEPREVAADEPTSQATPACMRHTTAMTLTTSNSAPEVGEQFWVTATLANAGCGTVGLPEYNLSLIPASYVLAPDSPTSVRHTLALEPGQADIATFQLRTIGFGDATMQVLATFEVHLGYPGPAYWANDSATPLAVSIPVTDTEIVVLQQAAHEVGCPPGMVQVSDSVYQISCTIAAGHSASAQLERFSEETAQTVFAARQGTVPSEVFHCHPAYRWEVNQEIMPMMQAWHSWLAGQWIITTHRYDDTDIPIAPAPIVISEAIYSSSIRNRLLPECDRIYLPTLRRQ